MKIIDYIFNWWKGLLLIFFILYPAYSLFLIPFLILNFFIKFEKNFKIFFLVSSFLTLILCIKYKLNIFLIRLNYYKDLLFNIQNVNFNVELKKYIFHFDSLYFSFLFFVIACSIFTLNFKTKKEVLQDELKRSEIYKRTFFQSIIYFFNKYLKKEVNHTKENAVIGNEYKTNKEIQVSEDNGHFLAVGTTGSGKTALITNLIEKAVKFNDFAIILDGKSDKDIFSLYDSTLKLSKKYNRKIYIVSQGDKITSKINPFKNATSTQIKDMLISLSFWSEEHYKSNASRFWQALAELMILNKRNINIKSIIENASEINYTTLVQNLVSTNAITTDDAINFYNIYKLSSEIALSSVARFATMIEGEAGNIFDENGFDLIEAYNENAIVVYLINKFKFPEFSQSLGDCIILDIKKLISKIFETKNIKQKSLLFLDEIGSYASDKILDILNKGRVAGFQVLVSTQSMSDLEITKTFKKKVIDNCNTFLILRNNDPDNAELLSGILGTQKKHFTTYQTDTELTFSTGVGTFKIVDEYIINPNSIKKLEKHTGIYYSKNTEELKVFKSRFVDLK